MREAGPGGIALGPFLKMRVLVAALVCGIGALTCFGCRPGAGGPTPTPAPLFRDVAAQMGIRHRWGHSGRTPLSALDTFGCGCAFTDLNDDGWADLLLVGEPTCSLYINQHGRAFRDATAAAGLDRLRGPWKGCAVADVNQDGRQDILLTGYNRLALLYQDAEGSFTPAVGHGISEKGWGSSAGFMDLDGDADLDLVIGHYVIFDREFCELAPGVISGCPPHTYRPQFAAVYENLGNGRFRDVTRSSGAHDTHGKALVVAFTDFNDDARQDFYIGNDGTPAELLRNDSKPGRLRFRNVGVEQGVALGVMEQAQAAMGADWADFDQDGRLDLAVSTFAHEPFSLYRNVGSFFENISVRTRLAAATTLPLGFGTKFLDVENDGWPDLLFVNGHVYDTVHEIEKDSTYLQRMQLFRNEGGRQLAEISDRAGPAFQRKILGRGTATADFDQDGRTDALVVDYEGAPLLLRNEVEAVGHWLAVRLNAAPPNRDAFGARVEVDVGGRVLVSQVSPASSYLSSSSPVVHFGLGAKTRYDGIVVKWPSGKVDRFEGGAADRTVNLRPHPAGR